MSNPYKYTDEEYTQLLEGTSPSIPPFGRIHFIADPEWSREETDYLFKMIEDYDSRFLVVHDRYDFSEDIPRSLEVRIMIRRDLTQCSNPNKGPERQVLQYL